MGLQGIALTATILLAVGGCSSPGSGPDAPSEGRPPTTSDFSGVPLVPAEGVYLGVYYGDGTPAETDAAIGRTPQLNLTYFGWTDPWTTSDVLVDDRGRGQISLVNWEPFDADFPDIVAGEYDDLLSRRAAEAAELDAPVFVDLAAEMNEEEGWGGHDPELYVAAYRHVHDLFEGQDGGNVVWVWAPNNVDSAGSPSALEYYPGDEYVDWTGIDGYNWGSSDPDFAWQSFEAVFREMYDQVETLGKPVLIAETSSAEEGGSKAEWITGIRPTLESEFPSVRALVWFDVDKERDWRLRSSSASLASFRALAADPYFTTTAATTEGAGHRSSPGSASSRHATRPSQPEEPGVRTPRRV